MIVFVFLYISGYSQNEVEYCKHLRHEHNLSPEDLEEAEVRAPRVNSQGKVKSFKCKQCDYVAVTKIDFWKHGRGHIKPEKLLFCSVRQRLPWRLPTRPDTDTAAAQQQPQLAAMLD